MIDLQELRRLLDEEVFPYEFNPEWERVVNVKVVEEDPLVVTSADGSTTHFREREEEE